LIDGTIEPSIYQKRKKSSELSRNALMDELKNTPDLERIRRGRMKYLES